VPAQMGRDDQKRKTAHTPSTDLCSGATKLKRVEQVTGDTTQTRQKNIQGAGFTRQSKRKAGRAAGPKTAPSPILYDAPYAENNHDMGTTLDSDGHSNGAANSYVSADGTADNGKVETDGSGDGVPGAMNNSGADDGTGATIETFVMDYCPCSAHGRDSGSTVVGTTGIDAVSDVNNHTAVGAVEIGAPHDTGYDIGIAHDNNDNRKVDDTDSRGAPETVRCHVADGTNKASRTTHSTARILEAHSGSAECDKSEAGGRIGDTPELASKYSTKKANGDIGAAHHGTHGIGGAQANDDRGDAGIGGGSGHLDGTENGHKAEQRATDTDSAKAMCNNNDVAHENVARARIGGGKGAN